MTLDDRSLERAARSWLEAGPTRAPDRAVETALHRIESMPQERELRLPWRLPKMFNNRLAIAALALVLLVAGGGFALSRLGTVGGPGPTATPTPVVTPSPTTRPTSSPAPSPSPFSLDTTATGVVLPPGTYRANSFAVPLNITLPAGWVNNGYKPHDLVLRKDNAFLAIVVVQSVYPDPCHTATAPKAVQPGLTGLFDALSTMKGFRVTDVQDAVISGVPAKSFTLDNSINLQASQCSNPQVLWIGRDGDDQPVLEGAGAPDALWIVDTSPYGSPGTTLLIGGPADVVSTIDFRPHLP